LLPIALSPAVAAAKATASNAITTSFSTGTFIAYATATKTFTNPNGTLLVIAVSNGVGKNFFIENGGTLPITGVTMTITLTTGAITSVKNCGQNILFTGATCPSGGTTTNNPTTGVAKNYSVNIAASSWVQFQLLENKNTNATISVTVAHSQTTTFTLNS
jgi:hypothetical protein